MTQEKETFYPQSQTEWRQWLEKNHRSKPSVWLVYYTKKSNLPTISWPEAVDEALCFGWIDSTKKTIDENSYMQLFSKRKPNSIWSKINKDKVQQLIENGKMTTAGLESVETAKQNGSWTIFDEVEEMIIPKDLATALEKNEGSMDFFLELTKSAKKMVLSWILLAKRQETRQKRIDKIAAQIAEKQVPKL